MCVCGLGDSRGPYRSSSFKHNTVTVRLYPVYMFLYVQLFSLQHACNCMNTFVSVCPVCIQFNACLVAYVCLCTQQLQSKWACVRVNMCGCPNASTPVCISTLLQFIIMSVQQCMCVCVCVCVCVHPYTLAG